MSILNEKWGKMEDFRVSLEPTGDCLVPLILPLESLSVALLMLTANLLGFSKTAG